MDSLIAAAARALVVGDALGALKRVALRDDPPALALRGIAMAQLGEHPRARELLRRAARGFGAHEELARARCVVAEAEVALAMRDLRGEPRRSRMARATSASATTQRARASSSWAPKPRAARRRSSRARGCSPSWAMAMPRRASAGGSSRRATRLRALSVSPTTRARAAAAIRESIATGYCAAPGRAAGAP